MGLESRQLFAAKYIFLNLYLCADETQRCLKSIATQAVSQRNISATRLRRFTVPLPPLPEQRKIAGVLGVVQRAMEQQERLLALTAELKKALLHRVFTAGLRDEPQQETEIGLDQIAKQASSRVHSMHRNAP